VTPIVGGSDRCRAHPSTLTRVDDKRDSFVQTLGQEGLEGRGCSRRIQGIKWNSIQGDNEVKEGLESRVTRRRSWMNLSSFDWLLFLLRNQ
jgi:hypothetical protein